MLVTVDLKLIRVIVVKPGDGANAIRRKELILVQHEFQDVAELILSRDGKQPALTHAGRSHARHIFNEVRSVLQEPVQAPLEARQPFQQRRLQCLHGEQRDQSYHGTDLHRKMRAVWQPQYVVEETIFFVPQPHAVEAAMAHGMRDVDEVLPELAGHVFVGWVFRSQLQRNRQQVQRVHGHPACAVGLFDITAGG